MARSVLAINFIHAGVDTRRIKGSIGMVHHLQYMRCMYSVRICSSRNEIRRKPKNRRLINYKVIKASRRVCSRPPRMENTQGRPQQ